MFFLIISHEPFDVDFAESKLQLDSFRRSFGSFNVFLDQGLVLSDRTMGDGTMPFEKKKKRSELTTMAKMGKRGLFTAQFFLLPCSFTVGTEAEQAFGALSEFVPT